jgi:cyclic pyranopterin phosphate synthase
MSGRAGPGLWPSSRLVDGHGRQLGDLRVSITDRCNYRCVYCMPEDGLPWIRSDRLLTFEEIHRIARVSVQLGVRRIRLTGGEPTVRNGLPDLVRMLSALADRGLEGLSLTTNGYKLRAMAGELAAAGLQRINVSLDTLDHAKYAAITRRDALGEVLAGLSELEKYPSISPIRVNAVAVRGFTEPEILDFARLAREKPYVVRFIEFMPLDAEGNWNEERVLPGQVIYETINARYPLEPIRTSTTSTSRQYRFADGSGEIGLINSVTEPFCEQCNRIRLTADGMLRTCLFSADETDLRTPLRSGASDEELAEIIVAAAREKELKRRIDEGEQFRRASRSMSQIGG